ncbi:MAG: YggU family protein [Deltaproteobacteria bacterium]|nr:YggU family protein [Deltaproteobacteria bacterium]MBW2121593.1 YggU family protein [Deltaproteobacteria bacterium]
MSGTDLFRVIGSTEDRKGVRFRVRVQPRARRNAILGTHGGALRVSITDPPVGGAANRGLKRFLARALEIPASRVEILSGQTSREKTIRITGMGKGELVGLLSRQERGEEA